MKNYLIKLKMLKLPLELVIIKNKVKILLILKEHQQI